MFTASWLLVACVTTLVVGNSGSSPTCEIPEGHKEGELAGEPREPQGGQRCQKPGAVEVVTQRCEARYCCEAACTCDGVTHTNSSTCSSTFTELSCFVEHTEMRAYKYICCNGYEENSERICENIDECMDSDTCDQGCRDTAGSFECYCGRGYQLAADGRTCNPDPTCNNMCAHNCTLVGGRYVCTCRDHYVLGEDGAKCYPNVKCSQWNDCEQVCSDSEKGFLCSCRGGYKLNLNGYTCDDIDECQNEGVCQHECVNTVGSYRCYCDIGFRLKVADGRSCIDDPTCNGSCGHACAFVNGRYRCVCNEGFVLADDQMSCLFSLTTNSLSDVTTVITSSAPRTYETSALALYMCTQVLLLVFNRR